MTHLQIEVRGKGKKVEGRTRRESRGEAQFRGLEIVDMTSHQLQTY